MLKIAKLMDVGAGHPTVARLSIGLFDLVQVAQIPDEAKERIKAIAFECMTDLVAAEKSANAVVAEIDEIDRSIVERPPTRSGAALVLPAAMKLDQVSVFFGQGKKVLQEAIGVFNVLWKTTFSGAHFHKALEWSRAKLGPDNQITKLLSDDQTWIGHFIEIRNEDEHPKSGRPFVSNYDANQTPGGILVSRPKLFDGTDVRSCLETFCYDLLTFVEELIALCVAAHFPAAVVLTEIPDHLRDKAMPVRFRAGLSLDAQKNFMGTKPS